MERIVGTVRAVTIVSVGAASKTLTELFTAAGATINANTTKITVRPASDVNIAYGADATVETTNIVDGNVWTELMFSKGADLRFIAGGTVAMTVVEEG